jgi:hypothetical protein
MVQSMDMAKIVRPSADAPPSSWLGSLKGTGRITGDIVAPTSRFNEWDALTR